jgi:hypothetical protein
MLSEYLSARFKWARKGITGLCGGISLIVGAAMAVVIWCAPDWVRQHISDRVNAFVLGLIPLLAGASVFLIRWFISPFWVFKSTATDRDTARNELREKTDRKEICRELAKLITKGSLIYSSITKRERHTYGDPVPGKVIAEWKSEITRVISMLEYRDVYFARLNDTSDILVDNSLPWHHSEDWIKAHRMVFTALKRLREFTSELCSERM